MSSFVDANGVMHDIPGIVIEVDVPDEQLVAEAIEARREAEAAEDAAASPTRWREADRYAALAERGWTTRRIAAECGTNRQTVSIFCRAVSRYRDSERPTFWTAYRDVLGGDKTNGELVQQSLTNEWYTPAKYLDAARLALGAIDLDPASCAEANQTVQAARYLTEDDDGLTFEWHGRVWLNPPYGRLAGPFVEYLVDEYDAGHVTAAVALVNAHCTDTQWFQRLWPHTLCFTDHRIDFAAGTEGRSGSTHGSVFAYLGPDPELFAKHFAEFGAIVRRWP